MSKRAEEFINRSVACAPKDGSGYYELLTKDQALDAIRIFKEEMKSLIQLYIDKGTRCMDMGGKEYHFWDGFHNCAENILRELEDE